MEIELNHRPLTTANLPLSLAISSDVLITEKLVWEFVPLGPDNFGMLTIYDGTGYTTDMHYHLSKDITKMLSEYGVPLGEVDTIQYFQRWRTVDYLNPKD